MAFQFVKNDYAWSDRTECNDEKNVIKHTMLIMFVHLMLTLMFDYVLE